MCKRSIIAPSNKLLCPCNRKHLSPNINDCLQLWKYVQLTEVCILLRHGSIYRNCLYAYIDENVNSIPRPAVTYNIHVL
jgi:hypothetical protein